MSQIPASGVLGNWIGVLAAMVNPLNFILVNRLVLNLRQVSSSQQGNKPTLGTIGTIPEPAFAANSLLGNLGASFRVGPEEEEAIEEIDVDDEAEVVAKREIGDHGEIIEELRDPSDV
ncbi:hypothetical protein BD410DRAFT_900633 [Rickenella mellea]|uniref:Uncharacterized protein n=1 Tax=Rickenella mellea TaxID=50990 RepID=A0A4Y7PVE2_9AGAM|nr:hypothetical protein BD410DRAFT_900633 [Rickenella mellea]